MENSEFIVEERLTPIDRRFGLRHTFLVSQGENEDAIKDATRKSIRIISLNRISADLNQYLCENDIASAVINVSERFETHGMWMGKREFSYVIEMRLFTK